MSCNCNTASKTCEPCMFCTPPGVTGLTTCAPIDPCEGETTDITCVTYTGQDFPCINVSSGDDLITVLLNILATYFPPEICCQLEGELSFYTPVYSYTFCYSIDDGTCERACTCDDTTTEVTVWSDDDVLVEGSLLYTDSSLSTLAPEGWYGANGNCYTVSGGFAIPGPEGEIQSISSCPTTTTSTTSTTTTTTSTTTTTTTAAPATCNCFVFVNNDTEAAHTFSYVDCVTKVYTDGLVQRKNGGVPGVAYQCGMTGTIRVDDPTFLTYTNLGACTTECVLPVTTTTTSSSTTAPPTYSRFYEAEIWTCDPCTTDPFASPIIITVADGYPPLVTNYWYRNVDPLDTNTYRVKTSSLGPYSIVVNFWGYNNCADACNPPSPEV